MKNAFAWSVRREIWEHRSVWLAPLGVAGFVLVAFFIGTGHLPDPDKFHTMSAATQRTVVAMPFSIAASAILLTAFVVGIFYCLDALFAERRDRSILFWKSMPVSDTTTVLSKAIVPFAVIPAIATVIALATQAILVVSAALIMSVKGVDTALLFDNLPFGGMTVGLLYGIVVHAFWYAPIYALLLVASVATRRPVVWIIAPALVVQLLEKIAFGTSYSGDFIGYRLFGAMKEAFQPGALRGPITSLSQLDPIRYLSSPGLWLGLLAAAALLYVAIRLRRSREAL